MEKEELMDMIINTPLEKVQGPKDLWEKHIYLEDEKYWLLVTKRKRTSVSKT